MKVILHGIRDDFANSCVFYFYKTLEKILVENSIYGPATLQWQSIIMLIETMEGVEISSPRWDDDDISNMVQWAYFTSVCVKDYVKDSIEVRYFLLVYPSDRC